MSPGLPIYRCGDCDPCISGQPCIHAVELQQADTGYIRAAAEQWDRVADSAESMAAWNREQGIDLSPDGQSAGDRYAATCRRCAESLRLEADTGVAHCMCHLAPISECSVRLEARR